MTEVLTFLIILKRVINTFNFFNHKLRHTLKCIEYKKNQYLYNTYIIMKKKYQNCFNGESNPSQNAKNEEIHMYKNMQSC